MTDPVAAGVTPTSGELVAVVDESSPVNSAGGVAYVVTSAAILDPGALSAELGGMFPPGRIRPFHWAKEGLEARNRMIDITAEHGVVAVAFYAQVGRRQQVPTRLGMIHRVADWAAGEGVEHLIIENSDDATVGRDRGAILDHYRDLGGVPFTYDWRPKSERLLWVADAIAGAVGEYVSGGNAEWHTRFATSGVVQTLQHP